MIQKVRILSGQTQWLYILFCWNIKTRTNNLATKSMASSEPSRYCFINYSYVGFSNRKIHRDTLRIFLTVLCQKYCANL